MISIFNKGESQQNKNNPTESFLEQYLLEEAAEAPYVLVFPGGGYEHLAGHEGKEIAEWFNERGIHAGVFYYQVNPVEIEKLLNEINETLLWLKETYPTVGVIGFSAGGHLAALTSNKLQTSPDFSILAYPVISFEENNLHLGSLTHLLGENPAEALVHDFSVNHLVSDNTPLTFIWTTVDDGSVPSMNTLLYATQLNYYGVPFELHMYQSGQHGLGLALDDDFVNDWTWALEKWLVKNKLMGQNNAKTSAKIYIIGDSTAAPKEANKRPEAGWGEFLSEFIADNFEVENHAFNGRSTKSFLDEGRFDIIVENLSEGDYLLIQFGHNDGKVEDPARFTDPYGVYQSNLRYYAETAREKGATPILFSSVPRRVFVDGQLGNQTVGEYPKAALELAKELDVMHIDAYTLLANHLNEIGEEASVAMFLHLQAGDHENYPEGVTDNTHFNQNGAKKVAELIAQELNHYLK